MIMDDEICLQLNETWSINETKDCYNKEMPCYGKEIHFKLVSMLDTFLLQNLSFTI